MTAVKTPQPGTFVTVRARAPTIKIGNAAPLTW
jgi:hypothetical protein